ncbi:SURF1 family cytochrome oxidase biogenesis protein [Arthrobacter sp. Br18]|uniref:SURF1 family protein n=1 Tax=Arthrobacter sp. Br18 TaxID=1312954 RepID=UPI0004B21EEA|nr:SURF1 family cytochrome oxidase biogenesis protein [Arthrobacter sp. Br18]
MLKTALKPRWILLLILAMAIASVFVLLSEWQLSSSRNDGPPAPAATESVRPLTEVFSPGVPLGAATADQIVSFDGEFVPDTQILIQDRVREGDTGLWVVRAFEVDGAPAATDPAVDDPAVDGPAVDDPAGAADTAAVIPVVLGWVPTADAADGVEAPEGPARVEGRLLPGEGPVAQRTVENQVPTLATAELTNIWDRPSYSAFVASSEITQGGAVVPVQAPLETVVVGPQPQDTPLNWLNIFYAVEWFVFAGFAFFLWWRLVADDHRRSLEDAADAADAANDTDVDEADAADAANLTDAATANDTNGDAGPEQPVLTAATPEQSGTRKWNQE